MFIEYLKLVGVGKNGSKDLTTKQAVESILDILNQEATLVQRSAFYMALRMKGETIDELKGFLEGLHKETNIFDLSDFNPLDIAINYDGKNRSLHILPSAVFIASGAGLNSVSHGSTKVPAKYGTNMNDVLLEMGTGRIETEDQAKKIMENSGFVWIHQKYFLPKLYNLLPERREFSLRTFFNVIEKLVNPFNSKQIFTGVFHGNYIQKLIPIANNVGFNKITVSQGLESGVEPFPFSNRKTRITNSKGNQIILDASQFGVNLTEDEINITDINENAKINLEILENNENKFKNWAILTSAVLLFVADCVKNIEEGIKKSKESLNSGKAMEKFLNYKKLSN